MVRAWIASVAALTALAARPASADEMSGRGLHWGLGAGGYLALTGDDSHRRGSVVTAELLPGGAFGRWGLRAETFGLGELAPDAFLGGLIYEAAAARPRLQIALVATAGATTDGSPILRFGAQTQLWLLGPLAVAIDGGALLRIDGTDTELLLESALVLRLAQ